MNTLLKLQLCENVCILSDVYYSITKKFELENKAKVREVKTTHKLVCKCQDV